ncbi:hypothetical protein CJ030_MR5G006245 [Morella rubra]|uniref:Uncharacterized protein n=1 Tax=Morella rubra TaxID=262757 RepID=A0A6A1VID6_9ROSI|nr:hypothetical protein CJ030_MR5G006245 [Morella rubra]
MTRALLEIERIILHTVETTITPIINSLAAMEKRHENIKSMNLELKKANDEGQKDIMQRIADVEGDVVQELMEMTPQFLYSILSCIKVVFQTFELLYLCMMM